MSSKINKYILYSGLLLLFFALIIRGQGYPSSLWMPSFIVAIFLKSIFLVNTFRRKRFKSSLWLILILTGVVLIFSSLVFKYLVPIPFVRNILFFGAISLKLTGLVLMVIEKVRLKVKAKQEAPVKVSKE